jgi:hydrogenase nickel incorporation protein HypB
MREAVEKKVLSENDRLAMALRQCYRDEGILCVNLVCPSSYDLGEAAKLVLLSVTEGEDKPLKYPGIFHRSALMILTKTNLLPHVEFSAELALEDARKIALSARTGEGLDLWMAWLGAIQQKVQPQAAAAIA